MISEEKKAEVMVQRFEQAPPGAGVPAGWLPEILYLLEAKDIPDKPEYTISLRLKERFLLRRLEVPVLLKFDVMVKIGNRTALPRTRASNLTELSLFVWPPRERPEMVTQGQDILVTLYQLDLREPEDYFGCIFRGMEAR